MKSGPCVFPGLIPDPYGMESLKGGSLTNAVRQNTLEKENKSYQQIVKKLTVGEIDGITLQGILTELRSNISVLDIQKCDHLVNALMTLDWLSHKPHVVDQYKAFLVQFVSAHPPQLKMVLRTLIKKFWGSANDDSFEKKLQHVHEVLLAILKLIPLANTIVLSIFTECFPYVRHPAEVQVLYTKSLLHVTSYLPLKRREILEIVVDHLIHLDVLVSKRKLTELAERKDDETNAMEMETNVTATDALFNATVSTFDSVMEIVFSYINAVCAPDGELDWEASKRLYHELSVIFNDRILKTPCSHVQFLLFYVCSFKPALCEATLDRLWRAFQNPNTPTLLRQMSAVYISGLLVRGNFIQLSLVTACLDSMVSWIHRYIDVQNDGSSSFIEFQLHTPFYCACQAVFYIFTSWHRDLLNKRKGFGYVRSLNFERIVTCQLNPLKVCSPLVVKNFASIARNYQLAYCYTVIEKNERSALSVYGADVRSTTIDVFPFDPYVLEKSLRFIDPIYRHCEIRDVYEDAAVASGGEEDDFLRDGMLSGDEGTSPNKLPDFFRDEFSINRSK